MTWLRALAAVLIVLLMVGAPALAQDPLQGEGQLDDNNPLEEFELELQAGDTVTISTEATSGDLDTVLTLFDPDGREVAENDDREEGNLNSLIIYSAEVSGTYIIQVTRYDDSSEGDYEITVEFGAPAEAAAVSSNVETLTGEGRLDDTIQSESYELELNEGDQVTVFTEATSGNLDTVLVLIDPNGDQVAENDDIERGNLNSRIEYIAEESGTYLIEVTRYDDSSQGDYEITVEIGTPTPTGGTNVSATEEVFSSEGVINNRTESESWEVTLEAGSIVVITAEATNGDLDTTLQLLDPNGDLVAENDDRGDGTYNSEIVYEAEVTGSYSIVVSRYDSSTSGEYLLTVTIDPTETPDFSFVDVEGNVLGEYSGFINDDDELKYNVELSAGQTIYASTEATSGNLDTVLSLYAPSGETLAINDDRGDGTLNSALAYTVEETGTYTIGVTRYEGSPSQGEFNLILQLVDSEVADAIEDTSNEAISLSGPVEILETDHFRIRYTLAGTDATTEEYAREFAETLEEMYDQQVNRMGWAAPPPGDDGFYDAYLADVIGTQEGVLGYARPINFIGDNPSTPLRERAAAESIIVLDNDYVVEGSDSSPQTLMRATTTHEFNHMIQFGYDADEPLFWIFEATAVWIETVTVGDEQDATGYIEENHQYPELCFATEELGGQLSYGDWPLLESLVDRHGERIVIRMWENAIEYDGLEILEVTLGEVGETLDEAVAIWRARNLAMDYDLGSLFPRPVWIENTIDEAGEWSFRGQGVQELGANYFDLQVSGLVDLNLNGDSSLDLYVIGIDGQEAAVYELGDGGTIDLSPYSSAYAMVFYREIPRDLSSCSYIEYQINVDDGTGSAAQSFTTFSTRFFEPPR